MMKKMFAVAIIASLIMCIGSCGEDEDLSGLDYKSYSGASAAIFVRNETNERLVAFKGSMRKKDIMGLIPAGAQNHGLKKNPAIFNKTEYFPMILITEAEYNKKKDKLSDIQYPFTTVYVFYNKDGGANDVRYDISGQLGGAFTIQVANTSPYNVELRVGGPAGPTLGYAQAGMQLVDFKVGLGNFDVFPVLKYYNNLRDMMETIYPTNEDSEAWYASYGFDTTTTQKIVQLNIKQALSSTAKSMRAGVAYLIIENQSNGGIGLMKGSAPIFNSMGVSYWNTGAKQFQIDMPGIGGKFSEDKQVSGYKVYSGARNVNIVDENGSNTFTLKSDYAYTVNVSGDFQASQTNPIKAVVVTEYGVPKGPTKLEFNDFIGNMKN
jgi:hypothetical protein